MELSGSATLVVEAPAERVWAMIADPLRMPEWSPECRRVEWLSGEPPAAVGVGMRFCGHNRLPFVGTWKSRSTVVEYDPPRRYAWLVGNDPSRPNTRWEYELTPLPGGGCSVTERYEMIREPAVVLAYYRLVGRRRRLEQGMAVTLSRLKEAVETGKA